MSECTCNSGKTNLIFACSGAANTGELSDQIARKLMKSGEGKMFCLAAIGAGIEGYRKSAEAADMNLVLDGCSVACGKKAFENRGIVIKHILLTDYGVEKGKTEITPAIIEDITGKIRNQVFSDCK